MHTIINDQDKFITSIYKCYNMHLNIYNLMKQDLY